MRYAGPFASVPTAAVFDTRMTPGILRVLAALASYADEYRRCSRSMKQVAERLGVQRQALNRPIRKLQDWGYLEVMHQFRPDGGKASNEYRILFDQPMPPALAVPPPMQHHVAYPMQHHADIPMQHHVASLQDQRDQEGTFPDPDPKFVTKRERITVKDARSLSQFNDLWDTAKDVIGEEPTIEGTRREWSDAIRALIKAGATPDELRRRADRYVTLYERKRLTLPALVKHWDKFATEASNGKLTRKPEEVAAAKQAERDRIAAIKRDLYRDWQP